MTPKQPRRDARKQIDSADIGAIVAAYHLLNLDAVEAETGRAELVDLVSKYYRERHRAAVVDAIVPRNVRLRSVAVRDAKPTELFCGAIRVALRDAGGGTGALRRCDVVNHLSALFPWILHPAEWVAYEEEESYRLAELEAERRQNVEAGRADAYQAHSDATRIGMDAARLRGARIGRPCHPVDCETVRALHLAGLSCRAIAAQTGVSACTVSRITRNPNKSHSAESAAVPF